MKSSEERESASRKTVFWVNAAASRNPKVGKFCDTVRSFPLEKNLISSFYIIRIKLYKRAWPNAI